MGTHFHPLIIIIMIIGSKADPCLETTTDVTDLSKRDPSFLMDSVPICDRYLVEGWYKATGYIMTTTPPTLGVCGTLYPVWLNGSLPGVGNQSTVDICQVGFLNDCTDRETIKVKNCGGEFLYKLKPLSTCNAAYCFERNDNCISGTPTDARVYFHSMAWDETISGPITRYDPYINLICDFTPLVDNDVFYHIEWYIDTSFVLNQTVTKATKDQALLNAKDMISAGKKIGTSVHCVIGAKKTQIGLPCSTTSSPTFFAGIEVLTPNLTINRKSSAKLQLRLTVPYGEETLSLNGLQMTPDGLNVQLSFPDTIRKPCQEKGTANQCDIIIAGFKYGDRHMYNDPANWNGIHELDIHNKDELGFDISNSLLTLRMSTKKRMNGPGSRIFENVQLPDIPVTIVESTDVWKGRYCSSYADPHMTTFDREPYECQANGCMIDKTYILYRNDNFQQEIQVKHSTCWSATCICAVAVRAGQDVFTFDACNKMILINFRICTDKLIKVIEEGTTTYTIFLPTGTYIYLRLYMGSTWYINARLHPSVADVGNTAGLCGTLDGNRANDFRRRYTNFEDDPSQFDYYNNHPNQFSNSWKVTDTNSEDLFSMSSEAFNSLEPLNNTYRLCVCDEGTTDCSYQSFTECSTLIRGPEYPCLLHNGNSRRKRDVEHLSRKKRDINRDTTHKRIKRQSSGYTEEQASNTCNTVFSQSVEYTTCAENVPNFNNESLSNCIKDLQLTGDQNLTQMHLEEALQQCSTFIVLNSTFQADKPDITYQITSLCQNNCSGHGICSQGNCTCDSGFGGSDCSFDVGAPPNIDHISDGGVCDKSTDTCDDITIYGQYFVSNMNAKCFFRRQEDMINGTISSQDTYTESLFPRTLVEGYCPLSYTSEGSWVTRFDFNISSDGIRFTDTYTVYVYQSTCQIFKNDTGTVTFPMIDGTCFINGECLVNGAKNANDNCSVCISASDRFNWTYDNDCSSSTTPTFDNATLSTESANTAITSNNITSTIATNSVTNYATQSETSSMTGTFTTSTSTEAMTSTSVATKTTTTTSTATPTSSTSLSTSSTSESTSSTSASTSSTSASTSSISASTSSTSAPTDSTAAPTSSTSTSTSSTSASASSTSPSTNSTTTSTTKTTTLSPTSYTQSSATGNPVIQTTQSPMTNNTTEELKDTGNEQNNDAGTLVIALGVASGVAGLAVLVTAAMIIKSKFFKSPPSPINRHNVHENDGQQNNFSAPERTSPVPDILFEDVDHDHISRPPSGTSQYSECVRSMSPTNDLTNVLDMFTASGYR